ncbi:MAG TPA: biotin/lipoyl-containing protein, partial [Steroidobacteraceae bacterium]|nr:biotin/lipoyl-containing protein [Steroidobacteraceae bacterium]
MTIEVRVPQLPESVADATLVAWHKQPGQAVSRDENLVDLETDKVVLEVPAPVAGVLAEIKLKDGTTVTSGQLLAVIEESAVVPGASASAIMASAAGAKTPAQEAAKPATPAAAAATNAIHAAVAGNAASAPTPGADTGVKLSPAAKRVAEENKLDPKTIVGSGRDGRVS